MTSSTMDRRLGLVGNTAIKVPVACATTANITLSGEQTIDGVLTSSSRVLVKDQTNTVENGIYDTGTGSWTRSLDFNGNYDITKGTLVGIAGGAQDGAYYEVTSANPITVGTSAITFGVSVAAGNLTAQLASAASASYGAGMVGYAIGNAYAAATVGAKLNRTVSVKDYGAVGDDSTDDAAAFAAAYTAAQAAGEGLEIPAGTYKLTTKFSITHAQMRIVAVGKVVLHFTGTGNAVEIDGGAAGGGIYDVVFGGECGIEIDGNANCTNALYLRAAHHCKINIRSRNHTGAALRMAWSVASEASVVCSSNEAAFATTPANGIYLEKRGTGEYCADCLFTHPIIEGVSGAGIYLEASGATGNTFNGGTSEANERGADISTDCNDNTFIGVWCEANTVDDFEIYGSGNTFISCRGQGGGSSDAVEIVTGDHNKFIGGYYVAVECAVGSAYTSFYGVETSDNGAMGIKGAGSYQNIACYESDINSAITGKVPDVVGESSTWTPALASSGGGTQGAVTTAVGTYTRVGKLCHVQGNINIVKTGLTAGDVSITGLPFQARNTTNAVQWIPFGAWTGIDLAAGNSHLGMSISPNATVGVLGQSGDNTTFSTVTVANCATDVIIQFAGTYETI